MTRNSRAPSHVIRYVLRFRNGVWVIFDRQEARNVAAFGRAIDARDHHKRYANGAPLELAGAAAEAITFIESLRAARGAKAVQS